MTEAMTDTHAVNPVKEQHTRLRVTKRMRIDMRQSMTFAEFRLAWMFAIADFPLPFMQPDDVIHLHRIPCLDLLFPRPACPQEFLRLRLQPGTALRAFWGLRAPVTVPEAVINLFVNMDCLVMPHLFQPDIVCTIFLAAPPPVLGCRTVTIERIRPVKAACLQAFFGYAYYNSGVIQKTFQ